MLPLFLVISVFLTQLSVAAHTENFKIVNSLAQKAHVKLDLTGEQSYAIYEKFPPKPYNPFEYHMRLIVGHVKCEDENNCDFVADTFHMQAPRQGERWEGKLGSKTVQHSRNRPWKANHYYDKKEDIDKPLAQPNTYKWAGPTRKLSYEDIYDIGEDWCHSCLHWRYNKVYSNCHHFVYDVYNEIKQK
ncbi:hypothetical protein PgNI_05392 [Pyricularia grisea]|uniref:Secreted protein n=1 Tax=Pyricularia grisea TaxID=148305 RepID=A0A6P8B6S1_PYRGI|nr:hypothetical protein PgNI_05392 [Pyricularia grisea]TLD10965.1 hypothetical protein PgNI_05392 [Pyricularia grisea]